MLNCKKKILCFPLSIKNIFIILRYVNVIIMPVLEQTGYFLFRDLPQKEVGLSLAQKNY